MSEVPLRRRIPPKSVGELTMELMGDTAVSHYDAQAIAIRIHDQAMEEIYRLARIGEEYERMKPITIFRERGRWCATDGRITWGPYDTMGQLVDGLDKEFGERLILQVSVTE